MDKLEPVILNPHNEKLDTWVETPTGQIKANVVMVHGFGTSKHETAGYFDDIANALVGNQYRVVRFDFSGYGNSEGLPEDACYSKQVHDLNAILDHVHTTYSQEPIYLFTQSMGCFVAALACPAGISKTLMTGIPNSNTNFLIERFIKRFGQRPGAKFDLNGISEIPRSTGKIQKLGPKFWADIQSLKPLVVVKKLATQTKLMIVHWNQDLNLGMEYLNEYDTLPGVTSRWLDGDHSVTNPTDRKNFIQFMLNFYAN